MNFAMRLILFDFVVRLPVSGENTATCDALLKCDRRKNNARKLKKY